MKLPHKIAVTLVLAAAALSSYGYIRYSGNPYWRHAGGGSSGTHYTVSLRPASFPANGTWDTYAQYAMADLRDIGDTDFMPGYNRNSTSYSDHNDGKNAWAWLNRTSDSYLGVTFVRYSGSTMKDCDIWYNSRYSWTTGVTDPGVEPRRTVPPYAFRNTARHETLHAIGFTHEDRTLSNVNSSYTDGRGVPHERGSGLMPQATDKHGVRAAYPASQTVRNVYAGRWRAPSSGSSSARRQSITGSWSAGSTRSVPVWLSNQSNVSVPGGTGSTGVRVGVYLSTNATISTSDARIAQYTFTSDWNAHGSGYYSLSATVPATFCPGSYYVGVIFDNTDVVSEQFETSVDNNTVVGLVTVSNSLRTLTVESLNPSSGVAITVNKEDCNGRTNGSTKFTREYYGTQTVALTAPLLVGDNPFRYWKVDKAIVLGNEVVSISTSKNKTATAHYYDYLKGSMTTFGTGCPGSSGVPALSGTGQPDVGNQISIGLAGARGSSFGRLYIGSSKTTWNGVSLPLSLGFLGMGSCTLDVSLDLQLSIFTTPLGTYRIFPTIPNNTSTIGTHFYLQAMVFDKGAPTPLKAVQSNALDIMVGGNR
jgi:hypothetical protein